MREQLDYLYSQLAAETIKLKALQSIKKRGELDFNEAEHKAKIIGTINVMNTIGGMIDFTIASAK